MSIDELPQNIESPAEGLSRYDLENIIFHSFRFSQGDVDTQELLFKYIVARHPEWKVRDETLAEIQKRLSLPIHSFIRNQKGLHTSPKNQSDGITQDRVVDNLHKALHDFQMLLRKRVQMRIHDPKIFAEQFAGLNSQIIILRLAVSDYKKVITKLKCHECSVTWTYNCICLYGWWIL